ADIRDVQVLRDRSGDVAWGTSQPLGQGQRDVGLEVGELRGTDDGVSVAVLGAESGTERGLHPPSENCLRIGHVLSLVSGETTSRKEQVITGHFAPVRDGAGEGSASGRGRSTTGLRWGAGSAHTTAPATTGRRWWWERPGSGPARSGPWSVPT